MTGATYGTGTIDQLPSGRWRVRIPDGTGGRLLVGTYATWDEAEHARRVALQARHQIPSGRVSLGSYGESWLTRTAPLRRNHRTDYSRWAVHVVGTPLGDAPLETVTRADVRDWMRAAIGRTGVQGDGRKGGQRSTGRPVSRQTIVHALGLVRRALQEAVEDGHLSENPATGLKVPAADSDPGWTYLQAEQLARLLELELRPETRAAVELSVYAGLRQGEVAGLRWADVEDLTGPAPRLHVRRSWGGAPKTKSSRRSLYLLPAVVDALQAWRPLWEALPARRRLGGLVFPGDDGSVYAKGYDWGWSGKLERAFKVCWLGVRDQAGLRTVRWHDLRHTCASHLVMGTWTARPWTLQEVRDYLGHTSITTTERYAHLSPAKQLEAVARVARSGHELVTPPSETPPENDPQPLEIIDGAPAKIRTWDLRLRKSTGPVEVPHGCEPRDQSVTTVAQRILQAALQARQIAEADVGELALLVIEQAPEAVRLALQLAELEPDDPMRGPLGLQLAAAVLAAWGDVEKPEEEHHG
jgi:integrase